jgi:hypothetical protein
MIRSLFTRHTRVSEDRSGGASVGNFVVVTRDVPSWRTEEFRFVSAVRLELFNLPDLY